MWDDKHLSDESNLKLGRVFSWLGRWGLVAAMLSGLGTAAGVALATRGSAEVTRAVECRGHGKYRTCPLTLALEVAPGLRVLRDVDLGRPQRVGDRINVLYLETRPRSFVVRSWGGMFAIPIILLYIGSLLSLAGWTSEVTASHRIRIRQAQGRTGRNS